MKLIDVLDDVIDNDKSLNKVGFLSERLSANRRSSQGQRIAITQGTPLIDVRHRSFRQIKGITILGQELDMEGANNTVLHLPYTLP